MMICTHAGLWRRVAVPVLLAGLLQVAMVAAWAQGTDTANAPQAAKANTRQERSKTAKLAKPATGKTRKPASAVLGSDAADVVTYGRRDDVEVLARQIAQDQRLDPAWVLEQLAQARYQPSVAKLVMPPAQGVAKNWEAYRARFVEPQRLREGLRWWQDNSAWLERAERRWGVPPQIVVAIVGIETFYGRMPGRYKVIDALTTLSLDFPSGRSDRSPFYRSELAAFLSWCQAEQRDPQQVRGSYAGAIGLPQFMPSSIVKYAVDLDADGRIDLDNHGADVVGSVARYLSEFGWEPGLPTHFGVVPPTDSQARSTLLEPDIVPSFSAAQMKSLGAELDAAGQGYAGPLALVELQNGERPASHVAGTRNFYVITRYNWSSYYAMAVIDLARALRQMRPAEPGPPSPAPFPTDARP